MPTGGTTPRFDADWGKLERSERDRFRTAVGQFVADLGTGRFRSGLRVKRVRGARGIYELTFADDGRATWEYGPERRAGETHIVWRCIGTHSIFRNP